MFEKLWEFVKDVFPCFIDLDNAYAHIPQNKLQGVWHEYSIDLWWWLLSHSTATFKLAACANGNWSKPFHVDLKYYIV